VETLLLVPLAVMALHETAVGGVAVGVALASPKPIIKLLLFTLYTRTKIAVPLAPVMSVFAVYAVVPVIVLIFAP
jgi:pyruvate/2-oxoglutarate/acetoin dehydrogenase E1 component